MLGHTITLNDIDGSIYTGYRKFRAFFGTSPTVCVGAWDSLFHVRPKVAPRAFFMSTIAIEAILQ